MSDFVLPRDQHGKSGELCQNYTTLSGICRCRMRVSGTLVKDGHLAAFEAVTGLSMVNWRVCCSTRVCSEWRFGAWRIRRRGTMCWRVVKMRRAGALTRPACGGGGGETALRGGH